MDSYRVLITDSTFTDFSIERDVLAPLGVKLEGAQCRTDEEVASVVGDADVVITQFAQVRGCSIAAMKKARAIVRYGIGVDNVDLTAAARRGIPVCNIPDYCVDEVADHTMAMILALTRQLLPNALAVRGGQWQLAAPIEAMRCLRDMTVGVVGFGRIGRIVVQRLLLFGAKVVVSDPAVPAQDIEGSGAHRVVWHDLMRSCDLIALHCPSTSATRGLVCRATLSEMKRGTLLVNASRGDLIVTEDLIESLRKGQLAGAALDVTNPEPLPGESLLRKMEQVILTSHVASVSPNAVRRLRHTAAELAALALRGGPMFNVVNGVSKPS